MQDRQKSDSASEDAGPHEDEKLAPGQLKDTPGYWNLPPCRSALLHWRREKVQRCTERKS